MKVDRLNESELKEILTIAQEGKSKHKEMSDYASRSLRITLQSCHKSGELKCRNRRIVIQKMIERSHKIFLADMTNPVDFTRTWGTDYGDNHNESFFDNDYHYI